MFAFNSILVLIFVSTANSVYAYLQHERDYNQLPVLTNKAEYYDYKKYANIDEAIKDTRQQVQQWWSKNQIPDLVAGITVKGKDVWSEALGYTDIENGVKTKIESVFRIASVSKSITSGLVGKLIDDGKLNLEKSIYDYLPKNALPVKKWKGVDVKISLKQVMSHMAGFRLTHVVDEFNKVYKAENVSKSLELFKNDELLFEPGKNFSYSNYGYQVVGAVIESVIGKDNTFEGEMNKMFRQLGMNSTSIYNRGKVVLNRSRYYQKILDNNNVSQIINADIIDDLALYEGYWAAAGVITTISDLLKFGNAMLKSFLWKNNVSFIKSETISMLWTPETTHIPRPKGLEDSEYGIKSEFFHTIFSLEYNFLKIKSEFLPIAKGWYITKIHNSTIKKIIWHAGGFLGASSLLYIIPEQEIVAAIITNIGYPAGKDELLLEIAHKFVSF